MNVAQDHREDWEALPPVLRALLEAELAAGNEVTEVGHSHPAPPAGAYFKLARPVSTRARASGDGIDFRARNSSLLSGEFTDEKRFYFVLEPPLPPPPEPDMDAIRRAMEPSPETAFSARVSREARRTPARRKRIPAEPSVESASAASPVNAYTTTSASRLLYFRDLRPPHEIQFELERRCMTVLRPAMTDGRLTFRGQASVVGVPYTFLLVFEAALPSTRCYSLQMDVSWAKMSATHHDYYRRTSASWFDLWTRQLSAAERPRVDENLQEHYRAACDLALAANARLATVEAIQHEIAQAMHAGAQFSTAHKEGGSRIRWSGDRYICADYGESEDRREFRDDATFFVFLRQFFDSEISRHAFPEKRPEIEAWTLILRLLRR